MNRIDDIALKTFSFPYKTILSIRHEIQNVLIYLALEGYAQRIVAPKSQFSLLNVLKTLLESLELPMSLFVDSFHLRKLLHQLSLKGIPAFSLQRVHPVIAQLRYIFQLYH